ncbi:hypothetical protein BGZ54_007663 [Gamsiella multidivaricata]|nr:hypothetical protein BGZ54_007663 [Gamsiella multidivaricata]
MPRAVVAMGGMTIFPEMEPPPMYHNGPDLPTYGDNIEEIALHRVHMDLDHHHDQRQAGQVQGAVMDNDMDNLPMEMPPLSLVESPSTLGQHTRRAVIARQEQDLSEEIADVDDSNVLSPTSSFHGHNSDSIPDQRLGVATPDEAHLRKTEK